MRRVAFFACCLASASAGLTLNVYNNTALAGSPISSMPIETLSVSLPLRPAGTTGPFSVEVIGTFNPDPDTLKEGNWTCAFSNFQIAFVTVDGHSICPDSGIAGQARHAPYNNSARGNSDNIGFKLMSKRSGLVVRMALYSTGGSSEEE